MNKCLLTGVTGLVGSSLAQDLSRDHEVYGIVRKKPEDSKCLHGIRPLICDLSNPSFADSLPEQMDYVVHLAQSDHFRDFPEGVINVFDVNTTSCLRLLDYARKAKVKTFVLASTGGVYDWRDFWPTQHSPIISDKPLGFYFTSRMCAELLAENYAPYMNIVILRFFFIYGPGQKKGMLIPRLVQSVNEGKPISLHGQEGLRLNPIYVSDAVNTIRQSFSVQTSGRFDVAGAEVLSLREIGHIIGRQLNKEPKFEMSFDKEPKDVIGDCQKMSQLLGAPKVSFEEGLAKYIQADRESFIGGKL